MRAVVCPRYGPPEVVELREVTRPVPRAGEVLVRVRASTVGPADCAFRTGDPFLARAYAGLRRPRFPVLGGAFAGEVVAIGRDAPAGGNAPAGPAAPTGGDPPRLVAGERVFGLSPKGFGAHAEYLRLPAEGLLARMPDRMTYEDAASILEATTGLTFLRDIAQVRTGQRVLVNGASGAVGCFAVQLAKHFGAHVTGVCGTGNVALVRSLGADEVIDYTGQDFTGTAQQYDVIFDAVGTSSFRRCRGSLTARGSYLSTVPSPGTIGAMAWTAIGRGRKARFATSGLMQRRQNLTVLAGLFESGALRPVIDRRFPLADIASAYRYVETGRKRGSAIITV